MLDGESVLDAYHTYVHMRIRAFVYRIASSFYAVICALTVHT